LKQFQPPPRSKDGTYLAPAYETLFTRSCKYLIPLASPTGFEPVLPT
jgi:hypothetical protein